MHIELCLSTLCPGVGHSQLGISLATSVLSVVVQAVKPATNLLAKGHVLESHKSNHNDYVINMVCMCISRICTSARSAVIVS